jgi:hypothetical protein
MTRLRLTSSTRHCDASRTSSSRAAAAVAADPPIPADPDGWSPTSWSRPHARYSPNWRSSTPPWHRCAVLAHPGAPRRSQTWRRRRGSEGAPLGRGQLFATPSSSVMDFGCDCWCGGQNAFGRMTWAAGGLLNVVRWARCGRRDLLLGFGVGGGDADEYGGPGAKWSPVLSELG